MVLQYESDPANENHQEPTRDQPIPQQRYDCHGLERHLAF